MNDTVYISFFEVINKTTAEKLLLTCNKAMVDHSPKNICILFSSPGGDINIAFILYTYFKALPVNITMHGVGKIDSCGINVFLSGKERSASKGTTFLLHGAKRSFGKDCSLSVEQLHSELMSLQEDQRRVISNILDNTSISPDDLNKFLYLGMTLNTEQALEKGFITKIKELIIPPGSSFIQVA